MLALLFPAAIGGFFRSIFKAAIALLVTVIVVGGGVLIGEGTYRYASGYSFACPDVSSGVVNDPGPFC